MSKFTAKTTIDATPDRVWEVLSDFGGISQAAPHLTASVLTSDEPTGVGASRHCDIAMRGMATEEVVTRWEEGQGYSVDIDMKGMPMRDAHADFDISVEDGKTVLTGVMQYSLPFGPIGSVLDKLGSGKMASMWTGMLAGFKERAESGAEIGKDTKLPMEAVSVA